MVSVPGVGPRPPQRMPAPIRWPWPHTSRLQSVDAGHWWPCGAPRTSFRPRRGSAEGLCLCRLFAVCGERVQVDVTRRCLLVPAFDTEQLDRYALSAGGHWRRAGREQDHAHAQLDEPMARGRTMTRGFGESHGELYYRHLDCAGCHSKIGANGVRIVTNCCKWGRCRGTGHKKGRSKPPFSCQSDS